MKKTQNDKLYIQLIELRDFMLTHDENTWYTERELAARIVNNMIASKAFSDEREHRHFAVLGLRESGISNEGCQEKLVSSASTFGSNVKGYSVREFSNGKGGVFKMNCPAWLQAPFEDEKIISDSWYKTVLEIVTKWGNRPATVILVTKKDRAPNLDVFKEYMSTLVANKFPKLEWVIIDTSEWKMFEMFKPEQMSKKGGES